MKEKYLFVIGGGLLQIPLILEAKKLGLKTIVSDLNKECIAKEYCDKFIHLDIFDIKGHIEYLKNCSLTIAGVLAAGIDAPETMAAMNEYLGLKAVSLETALLCKNKDKFRVKLQKLGYPVPKFEILTNENIEKLDEALGEFIFPIIVKPTNNSASRDMKIFYSKSEELEKFITKNIEKYKLVLIEELWEGEEQTVECLVDIDGNFHNGFITDRKFIFEGGFPVETGLIHPTTLDKNRQKELFDLAKSVAKDLNIDVGAVKLDTIYTKEGPRIIELTVRHSGGFDCQYLVPRSTDKNILKCAILTAIQEKFDENLLVDTLHKFGVTGSLWPKSGVIKSIKGIAQAKEIQGVEEIFLRVDVGDEVKAYNDCASRVIFIISTGKTREEAQSTLEKAQSMINIEIE
ncbi:ATP-grasp domain-containing protein [Campylobacterota bacterium DY0563]